MRVLIVYPNLPLMMTPPLSVALFTSIAKSEGVEIDLFETTHYADTEENAQSNKESFGAGRKIKNYVDAFEDVKPTSQAVSDFREYVLNTKPDFIFMSLVEDTFFDGIQLLQSIEDQNIPNLIGGVFPINAPYVCLERSEIDAICRFEGEYVFRDVIRDPDNYKNVDGIWCMVDGRIQTNPAQTLVKLDDFTPDYSLFDEKRFYRPIGGLARKTVQLETYRGCPYSCTFCNSPTTRLMDKAYLRRKSLDVLKAEIEGLMKINPEYWFIIDDAFTARPRKELFKLLEVIKDFGLPWWCNTRLDDVDDEILAAMKEAHCDRIQFGIESGNEEYRKNVLRRKVSQEKYLNVIETINKSDIPYGLNAIIGMPNETRSMVMETAKLCKQFGGYDGLGVSIFIPYHGTALRELAVSEGYLPYDNIGSPFGLQGKPILDMPQPYLQRDEITELARKFKFYAFFDEEHWPEIDAATDLHPWEDIYNSKFFYSPVAVSGHKRLQHYACSADPYVEF